MEEKKKGFFSRLVEGLNKTRENIVSGMDSIFSGFSAIDEDFYEELEETLIMGDLGIQTTMSVLEDLRKKVKEQHIKEPAECKQLLIDSIREQMDLGENAYEFENRKSVVLVIGVNGVGKTTSVGKLAGQLKDEGKKVILAAADTFRAAAIEQLTEWANRAGVEIIAQQEGSDPAAVIYDAVAAAKSRQADVLICDTAGRLHNKQNLMNELGKIDGIIDMKGNVLSRIQEGLGGADKTKGVDADIVDDTNAKINLDVIMEYGKSAPEIFDDIKKVVGGDLKDMTGLNVVEMTVNVVDVMTPEEYAQKNGSNSDDGQQDDSAN